MSGMNRNTGRALSGLSHLRQSIADILTTPIGSRVMQRTYGSRLYDFIDAPTNRETLVEIYMAVAQAMNLWERRFKLHQVQVISIKPGSICLSLIGEYLPDRKVVNLSGLYI